ncbi:patatin-like phospholipase family protein [Ancylobacter oerskovii]|uniref:Patatin-like phospholipase family protein n=1 Tax=Ancylobacter oerskovii TaxID=459519 RepID=A0ABW4Z290_9HYPH|nr:patatin-like phospholipase family protein [Ancylobacter oerskovii]MBS7544706.1 patatin-like phospholipase family protein [Ancylobacter oerskovii]
MFHKEEAWCASGVLAAVLALTLGGCAPMPRTSFTEQEQSRAVIPGIPEARYWADSKSTAVEAARYTQMSREPFRYLALSGGGGDGAFGAGFLKGWSESGTRPEFTVVSGVSTGALIAPFAFLGPAYDDTLKEMYTGGYGITLVDNPDPLNALFGNGVFDSGRLLTLARRFVTSDVIAAVAREHRRGRRLLVTTTNLDAERSVIWNMGAIAASGAPGSEELFRRVMTASASIPGVFTPTMIDVESGSRYFAEMHVDGSVISNIFVLPSEYLLNPARIMSRHGGAIYILNNGKITSDFEVVKQNTLEIVSRSVSTMIRSSSTRTFNDVYTFSKRNGLGFYIVSVPPNIDDSGTMTFDTDAMRDLYVVGHDQGRSGGAWATRPPAAPVDPQLDGAPRTRTASGN